MNKSIKSYICVALQLLNKVFFPPSTLLFCSCSICGMRCFVWSVSKGFCFSLYMHDKHCASESSRCCKNHMLIYLPPIHFCNIPVYLYFTQNLFFSLVVSTIHLKKEPCCSLTPQKTTSILQFVLVLKSENKPLLRTRVVFTWVPVRHRADKKHCLLSHWCQKPNVSGLTIISLLCTFLLTDSGVGWDMRQTRIWPSLIKSSIKMEPSLLWEGHF